MLELKLSPNMRTCPYCGAEKSFQPYKFKGASIIINPKVGICSICHKQYSYDEYLSKKLHLLTAFSKSKEARIILDVGKQELGLEDPNVFYSKYFSSGDIEDDKLFQYIIRLLANKSDSLSNTISKERIQNTFELYGLQTSTLWFRENATIFWYKTSDEDRLSYRIMKFKEDGHSFKEKDKEHPITKSLIIGEDGKGKYCLFGRHLIGREDSQGKPVCIVESEKSAIIASIAYPNAIWMATGSCRFLKGLKLKCDYVDDYGNQKGQALDPKRVILFPDPDLKFDDKNNWYHYPWYQSFKGVRVCNFLDIFIREKESEIKSEGKNPDEFDIADYIEWQISHGEDLDFDQLIDNNGASYMPHYVEFNRQINQDKACGDLFYKLSAILGKSAPRNNPDEYWKNRVEINNHLYRVWGNYNLLTFRNLCSLSHNDGKNGYDMFSDIKLGKHSVNQSDMYPNSRGAYALFGEHLLQNTSTTQHIALVESEVTAIICASLFSDVLWLATGKMEVVVSTFGKQMVLEKINALEAAYSNRLIVFNSTFFNNNQMNLPDVQFAELSEKITGEDRGNPHLINNSNNAHHYIDDFVSRLVLLDIDDYSDYLKLVGDIIGQYE